MYVLLEQCLTWASTMQAFAICVVSLFLPPELICFQATEALFVLFTCLAQLTFVK